MGADHIGLANRSANDWFSDADRSTIEIPGGRFALFCRFFGPKISTQRKPSGSKPSRRWKHGSVYQGNTRCRFAGSSSDGSDGTRTRDLRRDRPEVRGKRGSETLSNTEVLYAMRPCVQAKVGRLQRCWGQILGTGLGRLRERTSCVEATKKAICWPFLKRSDGLEPSTPSLPCGPGGNRSQPTATHLARLSGFRRRSVCHRLPPVAPALLHKCSILCNPLRQQSCRARSC
jgi:hypothetical protein